MVCPKSSDAVKPLKFQHFRRIADALPDVNPRAHPTGLPEAETCARFPSRHSPIVFPLGRGLPGVFVPL
jgi:hypothetical protein